MDKTVHDRTATAESRPRRAFLSPLNQRRWQEHVRAQQGPGTTTAAAPPMMPMPTAGALFNRPNPVAYNHNNQNKEHSVNPYNRERDEFLPLRGERWAIRPDGSYKRDIKEKDEPLLDDFLEDSDARPRAISKPTPLFVPCAGAAPRRHRPGWTPRALGSAGRASRRR
mgnify:CR=1 FL=1